MTYTVKDLRRLRRAMSCHCRRLHNRNMQAIQHNLSAFGHGSGNLPQIRSRSEQEIELQTYLIAGISPIEIVRDLQRQSRKAKDYRNEKPVSLKLA